MNVVIIGDSHVEALGPELTRRLPQVGIGVTGYTTKRGWSTDKYNKQANLTNLVTRPEHGSGGRPDAVIMSLGGNGRPSSRSSYERILQGAVDRVRRSGVERIVWVGPSTSIGTTSAAAADAHRRHEQNADWQRELLPSMGVSWIDSRPMTRSGHAPDGVHFTLREGYPNWASQLTHEIQHALASPAPAKVNRKQGSVSSIWVPIAIVGTAAVVAIGAVLLARAGG